MAASSNPRPEHGTVTKPVPLRNLFLWLVLATIAIAVLVGAFTFILRGQFLPWTLEQPLTARELQQVVQSAVTTAAALGLGITLYLSFRRQKTTDEDHLTMLELLRLQQDQHRSDSITKLRDRYVSAADQLGSESRPIRLAGIYALASLADDWSEERNVKERQVCIDLLTTYLALGANDTDTVESQGPEWETIWSTIFDRAVLERNNPGWPGADVRIRNVRLKNRLSGLRFDYGSLSFSGSPVSAMEFDGCDFHATEVLFDSYDRGGVLSFRNCRFSGGSINFGWPPDSDAPGAYEDLKIHSFNCNFEGTQVLLDGSVDMGGYTFQHCRFNATSPSFRGESPEPPAIGFIQMDHCEFSSDPLRELSLDGTAMVEIGGFDEDHPTVAAMASKYNSPKDKMH
ncbi:hypothetical protein [Arthrobacter sp. H14]|uniref:hypothetical protein n=1 Tax=Arthrobacter sp. H14 TaxID=1312959 RepID=UPI0012DE8A07|nr:hypothetical protein [Arthrobacter sp. H14]